MASEVDICNLGLSWLGRNPITSLTEDSEAAQLCNVNYSRLRDACLESVDWTFAQRRRRLTPVVDAPEWGYSAKFLIPAGWLKLNYVGNTDRIEEDTPVHAWVREGSYILANETALYVRATDQVTDPEEFSPLFAFTLGAYIASQLAIALTGSRGLMQDMTQKYEAYLLRAAVQDGKQGKNRQRPPSSIAKARLSESTNFIGPTI